MDVGEQAAAAALAELETIRASFDSDTDAERRLKLATTLIRLTETVQVKQTVVRHLHPSAKQGEAESPAVPVAAVARPKASEASRATAASGAVGRPCGTGSGPELNGDESPASTGLEAEA